jgi:flagellar hook-associated protein 3 FlgL
MAMRVTSKMMQNTSLRNINTNKAKQEELTNQLATGKKISRPSDDPIVAIRALKLNSSLDKIDQYYEKNSEDAENWLDLTSSAISTVNSVLVDMKENINQACNSYQQASDRKAIITNLQQSVEEIYSTGNAESGGRSLFTGYRTDMSLTIQDDKTEKNTITEQLTNADIISKTYVATGKLKEINEGNYTTIDTTEYDVTTNDLYRIRLAYSDLDADGNVQIGYMTDTNVYGTDKNIVNLNIGDPAVAQYSFLVNVDLDTKDITLTNNNGYNVEISDGANTITSVPISDTASYTIDLKDPTTSNSVQSFTLTYGNDGKISITENGTKPEETVSITAAITKDADGKNKVEFDDKYMTSLAVDKKFASYTDNGVYESVINDDDLVTYVADTGEILLGANVQERLSQLSSDTELRVTYDKSDWKKDDLDPVHYFYTVRTVEENGREKNIEYNENFLNDPTASGKQIIEYDIGNNQSIRVNTTADELFNHDMGRDADEVIEMLNEYSSLEDSLTTVQEMIDSEKYTGDDLTKLETQKTALNKAMTYVGDKINTRCSQLLTDCDNYAERTQLAETNCGSRGSRLELIQNRLNVQQTNFEELVSENEDADYTDLAIQLKSIEMTYEAALSSISYVMQTSLLDFI